MNTQIVYVVVSTPDDLYLEQAFVSIYTMRHYNPDARIILLTDQETAASLIGKRANIKQYVSEVKAVDVDSKYSNMQKSRVLKTTIREHIAGDYLFVDSDTIICGTLDEIDNLDCEIGAVHDAHHTSIERMFGWSDIKDRLAKYMNFDATLLYEYFNSGVMLVKDTPLAHEFYKKWHEIWQISSRKGLNLDQPSMAVTDYQLGCVIKSIPDIYNYQIRYNLNYLIESKIIHYFTSRNHDISPAFDKRLYQSVKEHMEIPTEYVQILLDPKHNFSQLTDIKSGEDVQFSTSLFFVCGANIYKKCPRLSKWMLPIVRKLLNTINRIAKN